jgi:hypothetical protein
MQYPTSAREVPRYADIPRAPRSTHTQNSFHTYRSDGGGREELARLTAHLMKSRNELEAERKKSIGMRKLIEEDMRKGMEASLASMTTDLLNKQFKLLAHQEKVDAKERELRYREERIEQLEVFLSEGQKYVHRQNNKEDGLSIVEVRSEHDRRQAELTVRKDFADREHQLAVRLQGVQFREAAQHMREQQYKAIIHDSFEAGMREKTMPDIEAKLEAVADVEYNRGFGAGKTAGRAEIEEETRQQGFLEGYQACHRAQVTLSNFRYGRIARDSPELDFVYDPAHPQNLFAMGAKVGGLLSLDKGKKVVAQPQTHPQAPVEKQAVREQKRVGESIRKQVIPCIF